MSQNTTPAAESDAWEYDRCPHFDNVEEETLRRLFSKVAAVRSEDRDLFDFTHREIDVYRSTGANVSSAPVVSEDEVYELFSESRRGNFAVVIEGEVGTGKSELCAYLAHRLDDDDRPILHVDKDDDLMSLLTDRIPDFYQEHVGEELPGKTEFEELEADIRETPDAVARYASSGALLNLADRGFDVDYTNEQQDGIQDHVRSQLQQLVEREQYGTEVKFVSEGAYRQRDCFEVFTDGEAPDEETAIDALNTELWREIRDRYGTASLNEVLQRVGAAFDDTRPVIVFEDFAITAMEARQLRNYMERDKDGDNWDFVVAGTRDSTEVLHTRTAEDRFEFFQTNDPDSNSVLFLDEESVVDFVRPYLGYFKSLDGSVSYDRDADGAVERLRPAPDGTTCATCGLCDESFRDLFPFHERFVERVYAGLPESQQSPREIVMIVFEVLEDYYKGRVDAPSSAGALKTLKQPLLVDDDVEEAHPELAEVFRWYGEENDGWIHVDYRFPMAFGFDVDELPEHVEGGRDSDDGTLRIRSGSGGGGSPPTGGTGTGGGGTGTGGGGTGTGGGGTGTGGGGSGTGGTTRDLVQEKIDEHKPLVGAWKERPGENSQTGIYLRAGLRDALKYLTDGFALYEGTNLTFNVSNQQDPFVFGNTTDAPEPYQIEVDPDDFRSSALRRLLAYGVRCEEGTGTPRRDELFDRMGTQLTGYADAWRRTLRATYLEDDDVLYKRHADYGLVDFAVSTYAAAMVFEDPTRPVTAETFAERYGETDDFEIHPRVVDWCEQSLSVEEFRELKSAVEDAGVLEDLLGELLGVGGSALDLPELRSRLSNSPPHEVLKYLGRGYIQNISTDVRIGDEKLRSVANGAYDLRQRVDALIETGGNPTAIETVVNELGVIDLGEVREIHQTLRTYDSVSPQVRESLAKFARVDDEAFEDTIDAAHGALELAESRSPLDQLRVRLLDVYVRRSEPYERFQNVTLDPGSETDSLGGRFSEVSNYYVE
ncbi:hypothetical protein [Halobaculum sp. MBLA0143]|uniref:hypothetical protein n=1 Tax=Halobaculum sp. MBLA0143 TaxID=3079933 RepID=UPI0035262461